MLQLLQNIDTSLLNALRAGVIPLEWTHPVIIFFADLEPIVFVLLLIGLWLYGAYRKEKGPKHVALDLFWHVLGAFVVYWIINQSLPMRPRPESISSIPALITHLPDNSFPSGHALFWGASWWAIHVFLRNKNLSWAFFILGGLTVLARVLAGIHYPGDIIVGSVLGWGLMCIFVRIPHGNFYTQWGHDFPIKIASFFRL